MMIVIEMMMIDDDDDDDMDDNNDDAYDDTYDESDDGDDTYDGSDDDGDDIYDRSSDDDVLLMMMTMQFRTSNNMTIYMTWYDYRHLSQHTCQLPMQCKYPLHLYYEQQAPPLLGYLFHTHCSI